MIELIIVLFFIFVFTYAGLKHPTWFIILYLLSTTKFFGFLDLEAMSGALIGYNFFFIVIHFIALAMSIVEDNKIPLSLDVKKIPIILYFLIIFSHGILYPTFMGFSSYLPSIIAGKHFFIFFILFYLISKKDKINLLLIKKALISVSIIISLIIFIFTLTGISTPFYEQKTHYDGSLQGIIQVYFLTYISLSIFLLLHEYINNTKIKLISVFLIIFFLFTLSIAGHRSIFFTTLLCSILFVLIKSNRKILSKINTPIMTSSAILILIVFFVFFMSSYLQNINIIEGVDASIASRFIYDTLRIDVISHRPYFGYGFIHSTSSIMSQLPIDFSSVYTESLTTVDSGYVDLLVRFGFIGMVFYLSPFIFISLKTIIFNKKYNYSQILMAFFIAQYFLVNIVWSVFSFDHGLVPLVLAIFLIVFDYDKKVI